jgi:competence ComEA-like helix-hairpin-helix protein
MTHREQRALLALGVAALLLGAGIVLHRQTQAPAPYHPAGRSGSPAALYRIDLNTADAGELQLLPGIHAGLARRIVESRSAQGPFASVDDLARVRGVTPELVERLRPLVRTTPPRIRPIK